MIRWERRWMIIEIDVRRKNDLYLFLGLLYWLGMLCVEWWKPGTMAPLDVWHPETWLMTVWKGQ
jgi:hypothetical protein